MPLSGKLTADFQDFYAAVQTAETKLVGFQSGAGKVEGSLNRMIDAFSGRRVEQDAALMAEAVGRVGGVSNLTEKELARVSATVEEATAKMVKMGVDVPPEIQKIAKDIRALDAPVAEAGASFKAMGVAIVASLASTQIRQFVTDVKAAAMDFIGAFAEEEAATKKLTVALQAQGTFTPELAKQYIALAGEFQRTTVYSDDLTLKMMALMVQVGGVMPGQMQAGLTAAMNLSTGLGIDLEAATMLVAKAFGHGGEELGRLKGILGETAPKGEDMAAVLAAINAKFSGQAAGELQTYTGRMQALTNQMSDFKEKVGELLVNALTPLLEAFGSLPQWAQTAIVGIAAIGTALAPLALSFGAVATSVGPLIAAIGGTAGLGAAFAGITKFLGPAGIIAAGIVSWFVVFKNLDVFVWAAVKGWEALTGAFKSASAAIVGYAKATYEGVYTWLVVQFQGIVDWVNSKIASIIAAFQGMYAAVVGQSSVPDLVKGIEAEFAKLDRVMVQPVIQATVQAAGAFTNLGASTLEGLNQGAATDEAGILANLKAAGKDILGNLRARDAFAAPSGASIVNHVTVNTVMGNKDEIAREVIRALEQHWRHKGVRFPAL